MPLVEEPLLRATCIHAGSRPLATAAPRPRPQQQLGPHIKQQQPQQEFALVLVFGIVVTLPLKRLGVGAQGAYNRR